MNGITNIEDYANETLRESQLAEAGTLANSESNVGEFSNRKQETVGDYVFIHNSYSLDMFYFFLYIYIQMKNSNSLYQNVFKMP